MKEQPTKYPPCPHWISRFFLNNADTPKTCGTCSNNNGPNSCKNDTFIARAKHGFTPQEVTQLGNSSIDKVLLQRSAKINSRTAEVESGEK